MKKGIIIFLSAVVVALVVYGLYMRPPREMTLETMPDIPAEEIPESYKLNVLKQLSDSSAKGNQSVEEKRRILQSLNN